MSGAGGWSGSRESVLRRSRWRAGAEDIGKQLAHTRSEFTTDPIWALLRGRGLTTREPRAMGAVMKELQAEGIIAPTGRFVKSVSKVGHHRNIQVWRSLLYGRR